MCPEGSISKKINPLSLLNNYIKYIMTIRDDRYYSGGFVTNVIIISTKLFCVVS